MPMPTMMDEKTREVLLNPDFDFSVLTLEEAVEMIKFWALRYASPRKMCAL